MISSSTNDKSSEPTQFRTVRRFPENNNPSNNNNNVLKPEISNNSNLSRQEPEEERKSKNLLSFSLLKSANLRPSEPDQTSNISNRKSRSSDSSSNTLIEEPSFNNLITQLNLQSKTGPIKSPKSTLPNITGRMGSPKAIALDSTDHLDEEAFITFVINKGEYLMKNQWNSFIGSEELKKYSRKVIERNDNIWEMVSLHYGCLNRLVILRDVYAKSYPFLEAGSNQITRSSSAPRSETPSTERHGSISDRSNNLFESIDTIVPGLESLIKCFATITNNLVNNHLIRPDRVITDIGKVLNDSINDKICSELSKLYGHFNFQRQIASQKIAQFKKYPTFLSYIHKCERDPRSEKKTLSDYIQDISMFWARMLIPLNVIIEKTMNDSQEVNFLNKYKEKIQKLITEAENIQGKFVNAQVLKTIVENYEINYDCKESERVYEYMTADNVTLVYKGEVQFELRKGTAGRVVYRDLTGVALENCLFFLSAIPEPGKNFCKYQLFQDRERDKFPALLEWGHLYGYFREEDSKNTNAFSFYVIIEKPEPSMRRLFVSTTTERNCWKNCMMQGFSRWQNKDSGIKNAEDRLNEELRNIDMKWSNTQHGIELIKSLDHSLKVQLEYRTVGFRCILEEELKRLSASGRNSSTSTTTVTDSEARKDQNDGCTDEILDSYIPDLTSQEGINDWLDVFVEWVNRLKFSLCSSGANITRSASEIEARKRPSIPTVKKCETFTSHDSPTYEKRPADVTFLNPPITKQKKDQRRISVSGFTNLFRINSKSVKHDESEKGNDHLSTIESIGGNDKDGTDFDTDNEPDSFMSSLSKDTVAAFNAINTAAKNVTMELIELRTQKLMYETKMKQLSEENQSYREFYKKIQKCSGDNQAPYSFSNSVYQKIDALNNTLATSPPNDTMTGSLDSLTENSSTFINQTNQMVECRRQTENLRQMYEQFANEKKKWEKEYDTQKHKIEKDKDAIAEKQLELRKEKDDLFEREKKHKENCESLQRKVDLYHNAYGINLKEEDDFLPDKPKDIGTNKIRESFQSSPHSRSHSDDVSHQRNSQSPISPPLAPTENAAYSLDSRTHPSDFNHPSKIPDQLRGSLINQERQSLKTTSSDNILDSRNKFSNNNYTTHTAKMTPSIDRKELYSNNNMCFSIDDVEDKNWSSDVDDATFQQRKVVSISKTEEKTTIRNSSSAATPTNSNRGVSMYNSNQPQKLGIPLELADKSKIKKDKSKKMFKK